MRVTLRILVSSVALGLIVVLIGGYVVLANAYMPLAEGNSVGPGPTHFLRSEQDPFSGDALWLYCYQPDSAFAWYVTVANSGPLPVTVRGAGTGPVPVVQLHDGNTFALVDLASYRAHTYEPPSDPATAPALAPVVLAPGAQIELWARYRTGGHDLQTGARASTRSIPIRYSVMGIERTADVPLRDGVGVEGMPCGS